MMKPMLEEEAADLRRRLRQGDGVRRELQRELERVTAELARQRARKAQERAQCL